MHWKELEVWKKSHQLTLMVYRKTEAFPKKEMYGLTSQIQRSAFSIPLNIVEGYSRKTSKEFLQFLNISRASLEEFRYLLVLSHDLGYLSDSDQEELEKQACEISCMLNALIKSIRRKN